MSLRNRLTTLLIVFVSLPSPAVGQADSVATTQCTYASCAFRMRGSTVLAGLEGQEITSFGFLSAPDLRPWIEVSDSATHYVGIIERDYVSGEALLLSGLLAGLGLFAMEGWDGSDRGWLALGIGSTGLVLSVVGGRKVNRARNAMNSAIWWYNASLVPSPGSAPIGAGAQSRIAPIRAIQHRGRAGTVLGSLAGLGAGLAVSSRDSSIDWPQGLAETLAFTGAGALIGTLIGRSVTR